MSLDVDDMDRYEERPPEPSEATERLGIARTLRALRGQLRRMGDSSITRELIAEGQRRARLYQYFKRADRAAQVSR